MGIEWFSSDYYSDPDAYEIGGCSRQAWSAARPVLEQLVVFVNNAEADKVPDLPETIWSVIEDRSDADEIFLRDRVALDALLAQWEVFIDRVPGWSCYHGAVQLLRHWTSGL